MTLQEQLDAMKRKYAADDSPIGADARRDMADFARRLKDSGLDTRALGAGQPMPDFRLPEADGGSLGLAELTARGPAAVVFYRGRW